MEGDVHWTQLIRRGDLAGLRAWLDGGGNIEDHDTRTGNTPLAYAANQGNLLVVTLLLERGAGVARSAALLAAVVGGHGEVARKLLPFTNDPDELREATGVLRAQGEDAELLALIRQRGKEVSRRKA